MLRVVSEIDGLAGTSKNQARETALFKRLKEQNRQVLLHQGVRFAFRVHQVQQKYLSDPIVFLIRLITYLGFPCRRNEFLGWQK